MFVRWNPHSAFHDATLQMLTFDDIVDPSINLRTQYTFVLLFLMLLGTCKVSESFWFDPEIAAKSCWYPDDLIDTFHSQTNSLSTILFLSTHQLYRCIHIFSLPRFIEDIIIKEFMSEGD